MRPAGSNSTGISIMAANDCGWSVVRPVPLGCGILIVAAALACAGYAAGAFDGTYTGQAAMVSGNNGATCRSFATSITVTENHLTYVHGGNYAVIKTDVAPDGSFSGSGPLNTNRGKGGVPLVETLNGKVTGGTIEADAANPGCAFHLSLRKAS
jgi:hypothetical protein